MYALAHFFLSQLYYPYCTQLTPCEIFCFILGSEICILKYASKCSASVRIKVYNYLTI